jgi:hypothetical protein
MIYQNVNQPTSTIEKLDTKQLILLYYSAVEAKTSNDFLELIENILRKRKISLKENDRFRYFKRLC